LLQVGSISGGPFTYAICQTGCNLGVVACFAAAGHSSYFIGVLRIRIRQIRMFLGLLDPDQLARGIDLDPASPIFCWELVDAVLYWKYLYTLLQYNIFKKSKVANTCARIYLCRNIILLAVNETALAVKIFIFDIFNRNS
jgi:hypothetical protein